MIHACISTNERNYLKNTLASFENNFSENVHIFIHEPRAMHLGKHPIHQGARGIIDNWFKAAKFLLSYNSERYMIFEDDLEFLKIKNIPDRDLVSPYCSKNNNLLFLRDVWHFPRNHKNWCGACCFVLTKPVLEKIVRNKTKFIEHSLSKSGKPVNLEWSIPRTAELVPITHTPSLILHVGRVSNNPYNHNLPRRMMECRETAT